MPVPTPEQFKENYARRRAREARTMTWVIRAALAVPAVLALILIAQCDFNSQAAKNSVTNDTAIFQAEADVRAMLRDPASAQFSHVRTHSSVVCGMVNSRNGLGGMTGPRRFIAGASTSIEPAQQDELFDLAWARQC
jgi:hypothetical protein